MNITLMPKRNESSREWEYELVQDFEITYRNETIIVPKYFSYDGATIPTFAWQAIYSPFHPIVMEPALVHDWLYSNHQVSRSDTDKLFRKLLENNRVPEIKVRAMYHAVDLAGEAYWENSKSDIKYLASLYRKLRDEGVDVDKYKFPPEVIEAVG